MSDSEPQEPLPGTEPGEVPDRAGRRVAKPQSRRRPSKAGTPRKSKSAKAAIPDDLGEELERRVGRVEFGEGALVRLRVPVRVDADPGRDVLTDIDVLSVDVDGRLRVSRSIVECKSAAGQSGEADRLFWLRGFQDYLRVERAVLARPSASERGRSLARALQVHMLDDETLRLREESNAWLPATFAHIGADYCHAAERRADTQLKAVGSIDSRILAFLRHDAFLSEPHRILGGLIALGAASANEAIPRMLSLVASGHALMALMLAALQDAALRDTVSNEELRRRLETALVTGSPDDAYVLDVLEQADELMRAQFERLHESYVERGAQRLAGEAPQLRELVAAPPAWVERYVAFLERLRSIPDVARDMLQTCELSVFDALLGGGAWMAPAFDRLFTQEHRSLLSSGLRLLRDVVGEPLSASLEPALELNFDRQQPSLPDRHPPHAPESPPAPQKLAEREEDASPA